MPVEDRWTFIDRSGEPFDIGPCQWLSWWSMDGLREFKYGESRGCIRNDGAIILPAIYRNLSLAFTGFAAVEDDTGSYLVDLQGLPQFQYRFEELNRCGLEGVLAAKDKDEYFLIGMDGKQLSDVRSKKRPFFAEGLAAVEIDGKFGYMCTEGKLAIPPRFEEAEDFREGLAAVKIGDKYGYVNSNGDFAIPPQFGSAKSFSEGRAAVWDRQGKSEGPGAWMIDSNGKRLAGPFNYVGPCREGRVNCSTSEGPSFPHRGWGYMDHNGKMVVKPAYSEAYGFNNGRAVVQIRRSIWAVFSGYDTRGDTGVIDPQGNWVLKPSSKGIKPRANASYFQ